MATSVPSYHSGGGDGPLYKTPKLEIYNSAGGDGTFTKTPTMDADDSGVGKILCVHSVGNVIGAATYDMPTGVFEVLNQVPDPPPSFHLVSCLVKQVSPTMVVLSRRADMKLVNVIREDMETIDPDSELTTTSTFAQNCSSAAGGDFKTTTTTTTTSRFVSSKSSKVLATSTTNTTSSQESAMEPQEGGFGRKRSVPQAFVQRFVGCKNVVSIPPQFFVDKEARSIVLNMNRKLPADASETDRIMSLCGAVNLEDTVTVQALAGLLKYMEDQNINLVPSCIDVKGPKIQALIIEDMLVLNEHSKQDLNIFKTNIKAKVSNKSASKTEGFSLYKLFEQECPSRVGRKKLRETLNKPLRNKELIQFRLDCIEFFKDESTEGLINLIAKDASHISNLDKILTKMRLLDPKPYDWATLKRSLQSAVNVARHFLDNEEHMKFPPGFIKELNKINIQELGALIQTLVETVDFEETKSSDWFTVNRGIDEQLDQAKDRADKIEEVCVEGRNYELHYWADRGIPKTTQLGVGFWPGIGFMMELLTSDPNFLQAVTVITMDNTCELAKSTPPAVFYKTPVTNHLNQSFPDPRTFILDRQTEIRIRLQEEVTAASETIQSLIKFCADVQCFIAMSNAAKHYNWVRPSFNEEGRIKIKEGRHPLSELVTIRFIPNDYSNEKRVQIITGPNAGGKSIFMKQVALIVYMAQIGSFVPADSADLFIVDKILTCITSSDSVANGVSYYVSDLNQMAHISREATKETLVIIDEFGKGTHPDHGTALLAAQINHFVRNPNPSTCLIATHFHSALNFVKNDAATVGFMMFPASISNGVFRSVYKLVEGKAKSSLAFDVAEVCGLNPAVLARAREITSTLNERKPLAPLPRRDDDGQIKGWKEIFDEFLSVNFRSKKSLDGFLAGIQKKMDKKKGGEE